MPNHKKKYLLLPFFAVPFYVLTTFAQTPTTTTLAPYNQPLNTIQVPYTTSSVNSVTEWDVTQPQMTESAIINPSASIQDVKQTAQYLDGLGRPLQTVQKQVTPGGNDMVAPVQYDAFGRETVKYLPYPSGNNDGSFKQDPFNDQDRFYYTNFPGEKFYYAQTNYEASPLNRPVETLAPGNSWVGSNNGVGIQYLVNTAADNVVIWNITFTTGTVPTNGGYYAAGTLYKTVTTDEAAHMVVEYKDMQGKVILKKVEIAATPGSDNTGWMCTFYIYDDLDNLRYVIQPQGAEYLRTHSWTFDGPANNAWSTSSIAQQQCFSYEYDARKRMTVKRVPGAGEVYMVYDARDRLVMTQDVNLRNQNKWLFTNYDSQNRPVLTGFYPGSAGDFTIQQGNATATLGYPSPSSTGVEVLTRTYYDDYTLIPTANGMPQALIIKNITNANIFIQPPAGTNPPVFPYAQAIKANYQVNNLVVGTATEILGTSPAQYLYSNNFYDDRNRLIETVSTNYVGGIDTVINEYSFSGQLLVNFIAHGKGATDKQAYRVTTADAYDGAGRLVSVMKTVGKSATATISQNQYTELGQLSNKALGLSRNANYNYTNNPLDNLTYTYNIRGWLLGINKDFVNIISNTNNWFGEDVRYDVGFTQTQLNGNIAGIVWRNNSDGAQRAYGYTYDNANRLTTANFTQYATTWDVSAGINFTTSNLTYDLNGNILSMKQMGLLVNSSSLIDDLTYGYNSNSNQLNYVFDYANNPTSTLGDFHQPANNGTSQDYTYDGNGNLTVDNNKAITAIGYNYLNLPNAVTVTSEGTITYTYDAAGNKLQKITTDNVAKIKTVTTYLGQFVYQYRTLTTGTPTTNDTLQYIGMEEGRIRPTARVGATDTMYYDYFEKDHLGDTRVVLTDKVQQDNYPVCTMEPGNITSDTTYYSNVALTRAQTTNVAGYPSSTDPSVTTYANPNQNAALTNGSGNKVGPGITLHVMSGDKISVHVADWYKLSGATPDYTNPPSPLTDIITALENTIPGAAAGVHSITSAQLTTPMLSPGVTSLINNENSTANTNRPDAFVNWILFDEQFNVVASNSKQVGDNNTYTTLTFGNINITKSGYIYIYVDNQSPNIDVYWDDLGVSDNRGPLLEVDNYYPFGLAMAGIDDQAAGELQNNRLFNKGSELQHKEFSDGSGLELYATEFRSLDPQIGRWWQIDPKPDVALSLYSSMENNPVLHEDPLGDTSAPAPLILVRKQQSEETDHFHKATAQEWQESKLGALAKNTRFLIAEFLGLTSIDNAVSTLKSKDASTGDKIAAVASSALATIEGEGEKAEAPTPFSDNATVVRGGTNTVELLKGGIGNHPEGVMGVSVECGTCSIAELSKLLKNNQVGITTVGDVRNAGGDVIKTSGTSLNHATMTGLTPEQMNQLLTPTVLNPFKHP